jgi:hypothetical protein
MIHPPASRELFFDVHPTLSLIKSITLRTPALADLPQQFLVEFSRARS